MQDYLLQGGEDVRKETTGEGERAVPSPPQKYLHGLVFHEMQWFTTPPHPSLGGTNHSHPIEQLANGPAKTLQRFSFS